MGHKGDVVHFIAVRVESRGSWYETAYPLAILTRESPAITPALQAFNAALVAGGNRVMSVELKDSSAIFLRAKPVHDVLGQDELDSIRDGAKKLSLPRDQYEKLTEECETSDYMRANAGYVWWENTEDNFTYSSDWIRIEDLTECVNCGKLPDEHAEGKCLFSPTTLEPFLLAVADKIKLDGPKETP